MGIKKLKEVITAVKTFRKETVGAVFNSIRIPDQIFGDTIRRRISVMTEYD